MVVDNTTYRLLGPLEPTSAAKEPNLTAITWTATKTSFLYTTGPMTVNATFLSPIEVCDYAHLPAGGTHCAPSCGADKHVQPVNAFLIFHNDCGF